ncbi:MAG: hypothetical protein PF436_04870 [Prolixibacteraceae bacterium]|jgi:mevalonate kinase|nr:hypothetical protein [Prolixibacteraceae bacterium]
MIFPSKILLIGEYGLVAGGSGLALPFFRYSGELTFVRLNELQNEKDFLTSPSVSNHSLRNLYKYFELQVDNFQFLNINAFAEDLEKGLWFKSNIPEGYGLGSSAALVASVYYKYALTQRQQLSTLKQQLGAIESFFHGHSSGVDPLVSYARKPLLIENDGMLELLENWSVKKAGLSVYLVDTSVKSETKNLVEWFKMRINDEIFSSEISESFLQPNQHLVRDAKIGQTFHFEQLQTISRYQVNHFEPMIPQLFRKHFKAGIENDSFVFKLCGSGGGGFMLAFVKDENEFVSYCRKNKLKTLNIDEF